MKKTITLLTILYAATMFSQNFTVATDTPFIGTTDGSAHLVDVDGDGDLDFFNTGDQGGSGFQGIAQLFTNDGSGTFTLVAGTPFPGVESAASEFADIEGDGDLDLILTGSISGGRIAHLYLNDGTGTFTLDASQPFKDVSVGDVIIEDLDGDSDLDVIISGYNTAAEARIAEVYKNNGANPAVFTIFTASPAFALAAGTPFIGGNAGTVDFFDVDNDGDMDVLLSGYENSSPNRNTRLYSNDGDGNFTEETSETITGINNADIAIGDIDGNLTKDIVIVGYSNIRIAELYRNSGAPLLSIDNAEVLNGISVYPIPSKGELYVRSEQSDIKSIQLFDVTGSLVKNIILNNSKMDVSSLPKGLYVLKINFETTSPIIKKFIKN